MKVDIAALRIKLNDMVPFAPFNYEFNEALNELEELRRYRHDALKLESEIIRLKTEDNRKRRHIQHLIIAGNAMRDELNGRTETATFKKWFKNLHPETIESITFNLRKKESN